MWLIFDIETIPDATVGRRLLSLAPEIGDSEVRQKMLEARLKETGQTQFLKPAFHQIVAIAAALVDDNGMLRRIRPLGKSGDEESVLVVEFFRIIEEARPRLVGWNSSGFDLPVLIYRALRHGIQAESFYRVGEPYRGYRKRFDEESHIDLMDVLSNYGASARLSLHEMAHLLGVPGKLGVSGDDVEALFESGAVEAIREYCVHDVMTTVLIFGEYAWHRGWMNQTQRDNFRTSVDRLLLESNEPHWARYRANWMD